jgi:hypothetical protein
MRSHLLSARTQEQLNNFDCFETLQSLRQLPHHSLLRNYSRTIRPPTLSDLNRRKRFSVFCLHLFRCRAYGFFTSTHLLNCHFYNSNSRIRSSEINRVLFRFVHVVLTHKECIFSSSFPPHDFNSSSQSQAQPVTGTASHSTVIGPVMAPSL